MPFQLTGSNSAASSTSHAQWSEVGFAYRLAEDDEDENEVAEASGGDMYVKYNSTLHGPLAPGAKPPLSVTFLRKFLTLVKRRGRQVS